MRLISIATAARAAGDTLARFPAALLAAGVAATAALVLVHRHTSAAWTATLFAAVLGIPLFVAVALFAERRLGLRASIALHVAAIAGLVAFGALWPGWTDPIQIRRTAQAAIGFHLLASFLPFLGRPEPNGFWQYNRALFLRFLGASLHAAVLGLGLSAALLALDRLFGVRISERAYGSLWVLVAFAFHPWFFLAGVPRDLAALEAREDYPRPLKAFSQFLLIPLVAIYLTILTVYLLRVLVTGTWPSGWIGWLVSGVAAVGILSLLLVHPIRDRAENRWIATYARWFYVAMLPAIAMLIASIWKRIAQYGVTEDRYFLAVLALWLAAVAVAFTVRRALDVRWIPVTLCALAFATSFGPWGAYAVSLRSQLDHVRDLLARHGLWTAAGARPAQAPVPVGTRRELSSTFEYLFRTHGPQALEPVLGASADADTTPATRGRAMAQASAAMKRLGLAFVQRGEGRGSVRFTLGPFPPPSRAVALAGFDHHLRLEGAPPHVFEAGGVRWTMRLDASRRRFVLERAGAPALGFPLDAWIELGREPGAVQTPPEMTAEADGARALLVVRHLGGATAADTIATLYFSGDLYVAHAPER